ncbi:hypothetical protein BJV82DRAFT_608733 [Fennellomyces sp. T-0311]|nr:hypothetical protein BJV82DRAFT_608733 [Fennellomyces sp. T-0311]
MSFPPSSPNSFPQYIRKEDPRFAAIHRSMNEQHQPHSLSRSKSTGSSMTYNSANVPSRRLSSGSACEVCRKRKTKCDGGNPCAFCAANGIECVHRATRRKKSSLAIGNTATGLANTTSGIMRDNTSSNSSSSSASTGSNNAAAVAVAAAATAHGAPSWVKELEGPGRSNLSKQTSCPSLIVTTHWSPTTPPPPSLTPTDSQGYMAATSGYPHRSESRRMHRTKEEMPSMMDQLSCRTFSAAAFVDHRTNYPIYPLSSSATSNRPDFRASSPTPSNTTPSLHSDEHNL